MKKKILCFILCASMLASMLSGCGNSSDKNTENEINTEIETEVNTQVETEIQIETEVAENEEEKIYTISSSKIVSRELTEFFQLWLGCKVDPNNDTRVTNLSTMLQHGGIVGSIVYNDGLRIISDYDDKNFDGLGAEVNYNEAVNRNDSSISYRVSVSEAFSNFNTFNYYKGTDAVLSMVVKVDCYVNNIRIKNVGGDVDGSYVFAVTLVNETNNPDEWLLSGVYELNFFSSGDFTEECISKWKLGVWGDYTSLAKGNGFDLKTKLVSEDLLKDIENAGKEDSDLLNACLKAYTMELGESYRYSSNYLVKLGDSAIPYLFTFGSSGLSFSVWCYEEGKVVVYNYYVGETNIIDMVLIDNNQIAFSKDSDDWESVVYCLCSFDDGIIEKDGNYIRYKEITEDEFMEYKRSGITLRDTFYAYGATIDEAYENMIIWE